MTDRNITEDIFFGTSNWKRIPKEFLGVEPLRKRLGAVLFAHIKNELLALRSELDTNLKECQKQLKLLDIGRSTSAECKAFLSELSQQFWTICKDAVNDHYEDAYFLAEDDDDFDINSPYAVRRIRAFVQKLNAIFAQNHEQYGQKYNISTE